ncbi:hypothetical protein Ddye_014769 [Dipteronia dyeriana]|uniref:MULE transposase domain-containing protein n=1 Tax=Dipteronia dyeriana TaxID=168575 RepID=A0AAD9WYY7_9ROSI|nr:hypothetical protein Ddye_014769 [Dipteronia dyeriana]
MDKIFKVIVLYGTQVFDLGECDADYISLINLLHVMSKEVTGSSSGDFIVRAELPWSSDIKVVITDSDLLDVFREFGFCGYAEIRFRIEKTDQSPIDEPEVVEQLADSDGEDTESDEGDGDGESDGDGEKVESDGDKGNNGVRVGVDVNEGLFVGVNVGIDGVEDEGVQTGQMMTTSLTMMNLASRVESLMKSNPTVSAKVLGDLLLERYNVVVDMKKLYNVKHRLMSQLRSDHNSSFRYLRQYAYTLNETNPWTTIHIKIQKPLSTFHGLFFNFSSQKQGFLEGCRPFIGLDGCHLKGPCGGMLISAVALDINSEIFSLAVCICEKEIKWSWKWFLCNIKMFLEFSRDRHLCFMSDRQKGLVQALRTHFPFASTRFCVRHIYANFRSSYPGQNCKKMFWKASRSRNLFHFKAAMDSIGEVDSKAKGWLQKIDLHCWSRFGYDQYIRCDHVTNNMTKAFNSMLGTYKAQTYLQLLEFIRHMVMRRLQERNEECST